MAVKVLVTGGAGYIGSVLVPDLLSAGYEVLVVDNFQFRQNSLAACCTNNRFSVVNGDVRNKELMGGLYSQSDIIIPLAALVGAPICKKDPVGAETINRDAILHMISCLNDEQKVIMPTTNSAYGSGDAQNFCTEESPLNPISKYAVDKVEIEKRLLCRRNFISFRLATVFGMSPRMRTDLLVNDFTYRAVHDKFVVLFEADFKRNYIHVKDVSRAFLHGIVNFEAMRSNVYNVGLSNANVSKRDLCEVIKSEIPEFTYVVEPIGKDPDQRNYIVSNEKIEKTGFQPNYTLEMGVRELIKGYTMIKNNRFSNV